MGLGAYKIFKPLSAVSLAKFPKFLTKK